VTGFPQLDAFRGGPGLVRLVGHRGARGVMPENTMEGFAFTLLAGVSLLEFDVVLTRDGVPVVTHNHHLDGAATRDAAGNWLMGQGPRVAELTLNELHGYDVGGVDVRSSYGRQFCDQVLLDGVRVPCLGDLLDLGHDPRFADLHFLLELKSDPALRDDARAREAFVAAIVAKVRDRGMAGRTILHSFDWHLLDVCRRAAPEMPTSCLSQMPETVDALCAGGLSGFVSQDCSLPRMVADAGGQLWCPNVEDVTPELVAEARRLDLIVLAWTVNETGDIDRMIEAGVDGIVTDYPGRAQHRLRLRGARW